MVGDWMAGNETHKTVIDKVLPPKIHCNRTVKQQFVSICNNEKDKVSILRNNKSELRPPARLEHTGVVQLPANIHKNDRTNAQCKCNRVSINTEFLLY